MFEKRAYPHNTLILNITSHFSHYCKTKIHPRMNAILRKRSTVEQIRHELFEHDPQGSKSMVAHQINRTFRHLHSQHLRPIIRVYFSLFMGKMTESQAKDQLLTCLKSENTQPFLHSSDTWDRPIIGEFATNGPLQDALHLELKSLRDDVVLIEWCAEWLNEYLFFCYDKGPGYYLLTPDKHDRTPWYTAASGHHLHVTDVLGDHRKLGTHAIIDMSRRLSLLDFANMIKLNWKRQLSPSYPHLYPSAIVPLEPRQRTRLMHYKSWIEDKFNDKMKKFQRQHPDSCYRLVNPMANSKSRFGNPFLVHIQTLCTGTGVMNSCHMASGSSPCWLCGQEGHYRKDCPWKKFKCTICGQRGHTADECDDQTDDEGCCVICGAVDHGASICPDKYDLDWAYLEMLEEQRYEQQA